MYQFRVDSFLAMVVLLLAGPSAHAAAGGAGSVEATGGVCGTGGSCCVAHQNQPGCSDFDCCDYVCSAIDSYCCDTNWDDTCAALAETECNPNICGTGVCPGSGSCCVAHGGIGCDDASCCGTVCDFDPICCEDGWDAACALTALELCPGLCTPSCVSNNECCLMHDGTGCNDESCCGQICDQAPHCCFDVWDEACVVLSRELCGGLCACPEFGDFDETGVIDLQDSLRFLDCYSGPDAGMPLHCECADYDGDSDADLLDLARFSNALGGP